jgi:hypothetical protein
MARALSGDADYVRAALRDNPGLLGERDMFGSGVARAAVHGGHPELLELPKFSGWSPDISTAAELGETAAVGRVLAAGAAGPPPMRPRWHHEPRWAQRSRRCAATAQPAGP